MHTFFVNTAKDIDLERNSFLFDNLIGRNKIFCLEYPLNELGACADQIAKKITREKEFGEIFNLIIYVEIKGKRNAEALAEEAACKMVVENTLIKRLYELGRKAKQSLILFGENFTRGNEYSENSLDREFRPAAWKLLCKCPIEEAVSWTNNNVACANRDPSDVFEEFVALIVPDSGSNSAWLPDGDCFSQLFGLFFAYVEQKVKRLNGSKDGLDADQLYECLHAALRDKINPEEVKDKVAESAYYAHVRLEDSDVNAKNRSEYRILLFVYRCAASEEIRLCEAPENQVENEPPESQWNHMSIPQINWESFSGMLKTRKRKLEQKLEEIGREQQEPFSDFNRSLLDEQDILPLDKLPKLTETVDIQTGWTIKKLKETVDETIDTIETKSRENEKQIGEYISTVTESFTDYKSAKMGGKTYKANDGGSGERQTKNDDTNRLFLDEQQDLVDGRIASCKTASLDADDLDADILAAHNKTDYYFDCLKKGALVYVIGAIFLAVFAVPYAVIQKTVFSVPYGWLFYGTTIAVIAAVYCLAYLLFVRIFKMKIVKELRNLCEKFAISQNNRLQSLKKYRTLLAKEIPLSYFLTLYREEFEEYCETKKAALKWRTYHAKMLDEYIRYIQNTLELLDIERLGKDDQSNLETKIRVEESKYGNNEVYVIVEEKFDYLKKGKDSDD